MKKLTGALLLSLMVAGLTLLSLPAWGQEVTAAVVGTVTDPSGAPVKGAICGPQRIDDRRRAFLSLIYSLAGAGLRSAPANVRPRATTYPPRV